MAIQWHVLLGHRVWFSGLGFRFRVWSLGFRVQGLEFRAKSLRNLVMLNPNISCAAKFCGDTVCPRLLRVPNHLHVLPYRIAEGRSNLGQGFSINSVIFIPC